MKHEPLIIIGLLLMSSAVFSLEETSPKRIEEVNKRTQETVPFAVDQTLQTFTKTVHGGVQHLVVKSADNTRQIKLIQDYLGKMADEFRNRDFSEPERIHGADMPGLAQLKMAETDDIKYEYEALPDGAQIHYTTEETRYVQALHQWFDAQRSEHGNVDIPAHKQHHLTPAE